MKFDPSKVIPVIELAHTPNLDPEYEGPWMVGAVHCYSCDMRFVGAQSVREWPKGPACRFCAGTDTKFLAWNHETGGVMGLSFAKIDGTTKPLDADPPTAAP